MGSKAGAANPFRPTLATTDHLFFRPHPSASGCRLVPSYDLGLTSHLLFQGFMTRCNKPLQALPSVPHQADAAMLPYAHCSPCA
jgi:hypothetical protein